MKEKFEKTKEIKRRAESTASEKTENNNNVENRKGVKIAYLA